MGVEVFNVPGEQRKTFTKEKMWTHFTYAWFRPISIQGRAQEAQIFALCIIEELPFPALYRSNLFRSHLTLGEETLQLPVCQGVNKTATLLWVCSTIAQQGKAWEKKASPNFSSQSPLLQGWIRTHAYDLTAGVWLCFSLLYIRLMLFLLCG